MNMLPTTLYCQDLVIDLQAGWIQGRQDQARVGPVNLRVLTVLLASQGDLVTRARLFEDVWPNQEISDEALTRAISDIRSIFKRLSSNDLYIETVPKKGYRWIPRIDTDNPHPEGSGPEDYSAAFNERTKRGFPWMSLKWLLLLAATILGLLSFSVWSISAMLTRPSANLAILAPVSQSSQLADGYHEALLARFIDGPEVNVLAESAIKDFSGNVYPSLYHQYGTRWIVESQIRPLTEDVTVITSLVDARSGFVVYRQVNTHPQTSSWLSQEANGFYVDIASWLAH
ncbi:MAG TPA: winged helix-turn-helix domain-containing protein [Cellvibrionaceae bacterium]